MSLDSRDSLYIGGQWVAPAGTEVFEVENPATEQVFATVPRGTVADLDAAVAAARAAFDGWAATPPKERAEVLRRISEGLAAKRDEIAATITAEMGCPTKTAAAVQAGLPVIDVAALADVLASYEFETEIGPSLVVREPVGVVGAITPWNYPLHQITAKVAGALAAGCTVVLKPSELTPLSAYVFADVVHEAGLPAGVFNLVTGTGAEVGAAIGAHPDIDMVSFTGSTRAGREVTKGAAETVKRVALELGGKSANVILPGADVAAAVKVGVANAFLNGGQTCTAWTRMVVPADQHDEIVGLAVAAAEKMTVGDPTDAGTRVGPMASGAQRDRVRDYIQKGVDEGAVLATGGAEAPEGLSTGYYVKPTVFGAVKTGMTIAQEEIFGPVLSILPYADEAEAVAIANDSVYGLAGGVWAADTETGVEFARKIRTGQVDVNGGRFNPAAPFGGYKQSGNGRELGVFGLEEFLEVKAIQR